jgi:hypothetical protein
MVGLPLNSAIDHIHNNSATAISMVTQIRRNPGIFLNAREKSLLKIRDSPGTRHMNAIGVDPPPVEGCCGELTRAV